MYLEVANTKIDLKKIGINFIPNEEQVSALNHLAEFMKNDGMLTTVLSGSAGTGKTSIVKIFLEYIRLTSKNNIRLVAPTHKAKAVLSRLSSGANATTLHKLLGLKPNFNILEFDAKNMKFLESLNLQIFETPKDLIIVDECSMVNDPLYDLLVKRMAKKGKILFLGDDKQIAPVKQGTSSKVFFHTDFPGYHLSKVERQQDNPLLDTLVRIRSGDEIFYETNISSDNKGIIVHNLASFKEALSETFFSLEILNKAPQGTKILAYTNARVQAFNEFARKLMGCNKVSVNKGELMMAYDSYSKGFDEVLFNGSEYIVKSAVHHIKNLPGYGDFKGYKLTLTDIHTGDDSMMFLLDPESPESNYKNLGIVMENIRMDAVEGNARKRRPYLWKPFYAINESFVTMKDIVYDNRVIRKKTLDYGYAMTVHKSQSSTHTNVFVDIDNINTCKDVNERRQLQYVALSRPTHYAHILRK